MGSGTYSCEDIHLFRPFRHEIDILVQGSKLHSALDTLEYGIWSRQIEGKCSSLCLQLFTVFKILSRGPWYRQDDP